MFRIYVVILASLLMLPGCANRMRSKEKVEQAILDRLQTHSGLDLNTLDVTTTAVTFDKNMAYATVAFHPKADPTVNGGMTMKYTLEQRSGKWVVVKVGAPGQSTLGAGAEGQLPPGHPGVGAMPPGEGSNGRQQ